MVDPLPDVAPVPAPETIWLRFADNGNIRKWSAEPFEDGHPYQRLANGGVVPGSASGWSICLICHGHNGKHAEGCMKGEAS